MKKSASLTGGKSRYLFLAPGLLVYLGIIVLPALYSLYLSFFKWNGVSPDKEFVGINNYIWLVKNDPVFWVALKNNVVWILMTLLFTIPIALLFALLINRQFVGRTLVRGVLYFPFVLSGITAAITWKWVYNPQLGMYVNLVEQLGLPQLAKAWLADSSTAFFAVFIGGFWHSVGQPMVLFLSGLQTIPAELSEASSIDGATKFQNFFYVTLPMLRETLFIVIATQIIYSLKVYDLVQGMTSGGPSQSTHTLATWMVAQTYSFNNVGVGTALAWFLVAVCMIVVIPYVSRMTKEG